MPNRRRIPGDKSRLRLWVLLGLLLAVTGLGLLRYPPGWIIAQAITPHSCQGPVPDGLDELKSLAKELGYPGFQLAWVDAHGKTNACAAGWAHRGLWPRRMTLGHRLRYVSLTKLLTATVAMQLIAEQRLWLNDPVVERLAIAEPYQDPRIADLRVAHLLEHTAGFDRRISPDPMFQPEPWCPQRPETLATLQLDHNPGAVYAYANIGYCLLGAIIERIEQQPLAEVFEQRLFLPAHISNIQPAKRGEHQPDEPDYFIAPQESLHALLEHNYAASIATGAFTGTAVDLRDLLIAVFTASDPLLTPQTQTQMLRIHRPCDLSEWRTCHGYGFYASALKMDR